MKTTVTVSLEQGTAALLNEEASACGMRRSQYVESVLRSHFHPGHKVRRVDALARQLAALALDAGAGLPTAGPSTPPRRAGAVAGRAGRVTQQEDEEEDEE